MSEYIFWYHLGKRATTVEIDGEIKLISPHSYFLAPSTQKFPPAKVRLFKKKQPPKDTVERFKASETIRREYKDKLDDETATALAMKKEEAKVSRKSRRGERTAKKMSMGESVEEQGAKQPPKKGSSEPKSESKSSKKDKGKDKGSNN